MVFAAMIAAAALESASLQRSGELAAGIGVQVRLQDAQGPYRDLPRVLSCLDYLGVHAIRDAAPRSLRQVRDRYLPLAKSGVRFDFDLGADPWPSAGGSIEALEKGAPGAVLSVEEPVSASREGASPGVTGTHRLLRAHAAAAQIGSLAASKSAAAGEEGDLRIDVGLGYAAPSGPPDLAERAQARLLLIQILEDAARGVSAEYIDALLDGAGDPASPEPQARRGLFNSDYSPTPAARMIHLITGIFGEPGASGSSAPAKPIDVTWSGAASDLRTLVLSKADGEIDAVFWRTPASRDLAGRVDQTLAPYPVDVRLPGRRGRVVVNDPASALRGQVRAGAPVTRLWIGSDPLVLQIMPAAEAASEPGAGGGAQERRP